MRIPIIREKKRDTANDRYFAKTKDRDSFIYYSSRALTSHASASKIMPMRQNRKLPLLKYSVPLKETKRDSTSPTERQPRHLLKKKNYTESDYRPRAQDMKVPKLLRLDLWINLTS